MNKDALLFINRGSVLNVTTVAGVDAGGPSTYTGEPRQNKKGEGYYLWKLADPQGNQHTYYVKPELNQLLDGQYSPGTPLTISCTSDTEYTVTHGAAPGAAPPVAPPAAPVPADAPPASTPPAAAPVAPPVAAAAPVKGSAYHDLRAELRTCVEDCYYDWSSVFGDGLKPDAETIQKLAVTLFLQCKSRDVKVDVQIPF